MTHAPTIPIVCPDCDLLQRMPGLEPGMRCLCLRCRRVLAARPAGSEDLPLALAISAAIAYLVANLIPLMELSVVGRYSSTTITGGAFEMWLQGQRATAVLVAFSAVIAPGGYILMMLALLLAARRPRLPEWAGEVLRWVSHLQTWSMVEVMMLGVLVALVKIAQLATVTPGVGMYAFGALVLLLPAIGLAIDRAALWRRVAWAGSTPAGRRAGAGA